MPFPNEETQFREGESGNPNGRPLGTKNRSTIAKEVLKMAAKYPVSVFKKLKKQYPALEKEMTIEEMMTIIQANKAIVKQDTYAYISIMDSGYGKAGQSMELTGANGKELIPPILKVQIVHTQKPQE